MGAPPGRWEPSEDDLVFYSDVSVFGPRGNPPPSVNSVILPLDLSWEELQERFSGMKRDPNWVDKIVRTPDDTIVSPEGRMQFLGKCIAAVNPRSGKQEHFLPTNPKMWDKRGFVPKAKVSSTVKMVNMQYSLEEAVAYSAKYPPAASKPAFDIRDQPIFPNCELYLQHLRAHSCHEDDHFWWPDNSLTFMLALMGSLQYGAPGQMFCIRNAKPHPPWLVS